MRLSISTFKMCLDLIAACCILYLLYFIWWMHYHYQPGSIPAPLIIALIDILLAPLGLGWLLQRHLAAIVRNFPFVATYLRSAKYHAVTLFIGALLVMLAKIYWR
jgi:hypothetical protein